MACITNISEKLASGAHKMSVIGLGYVGMPLAAAFAKKAQVIGFDISAEKVALYNSGADPTEEVGGAVLREILRSGSAEFTSDETRLRESAFHIVAVPTPINLDKTPDLSPVEDACALIGRNLAKGSYVVFESTVYPGVTEDVCVPILERASSMKHGEDFKVGYSPERINPGDKKNTLENIVKIAAGTDAESLEEVAAVYELVIAAGVHRAPTIKVAEAAKVVENSQRDINIAFMNEMAMAFEKMGVDTKDVIEAMNTKWNALKFTPGLVGGHCIGVDPYYFIYEAEKLGYHSQIISAGRKINDGMGQFVTDIIIRQLVLANKAVKKAKVAVLGVTFKENCPDPRNSKAADIVKNLRQYGIEPVVVDPVADESEVMRAYGIRLHEMSVLENMDCLIFAVAHDIFAEMKPEEYTRCFGDFPNEEKVIIDVKGILDKNALTQTRHSYWRL